MKRPLSQDPKKQHQPKTHRVGWVSAQETQPGLKSKPFSYSGFGLNRLLKTAASVFVAISLTSCQSKTFIEIPLFRSQRSLSDVELSLVVQPDEEPGNYRLSGTVELPDEETELTVLAVRYLTLKRSPFTVLTPRPTYSILAYETVEVENNRWETELSLWQPSPTGQFKETWQLQAPDLDLAVEPEEDVFFLATLTPLEDLAEIERQLAEENRRISNRFVQTTTEGRRYLQTGQSLKVALPNETGDPILIRQEDLNGGWGNRYRQLPDLPNERELEFPENRRTNAPTVSEEYLY